MIFAAKLLFGQRVAVAETHSELYLRSKISVLRKKLMNENC